MNVQFVHDLLAVFLDGLDADAQIAGDLLAEGKPDAEAAELRIAHEVHRPGEWCSAGTS